MKRCEYIETCKSINPKTNPATKKQLERCPKKRLKCYLAQSCWKVE